VSYFYIFDLFGGSFLGARLGYPLTHPALPIVHLLQPWCNKKKVEPVLVPLFPQQKTLASLYHALHHATAVVAEAPRIFITPERAVAAVLDDEVAAMTCCTQLLTGSDLLCVGALSCTGTALHQAAYIYTQSGIQSVVSKQALVPFYEYLPAFFQKNVFSKKLFLDTAEPFCQAESALPPLITWGGQKVQPLICADFFLSQKIEKSANIWVVLVNDSVLEPYAAELLARVAQWRALQYGGTCFYVGWRNSLKI
jgi:apolipoprotein N-acyltransferase